MLKTELKTITYRDGRTDKIPVAVQLPIEDIYRFIRFIGSSETPQLVAMCCDKETKWVNLLKPKSFGELAGFCINANFPEAMEIIEADPIAGVMAQGFLRGLGESLKDLTPEQLERLSKVSGAGGTNTSPSSPATSPAPAPSESAEAIGTASSA